VFALNQLDKGATAGADGAVPAGVCPASTTYSPIKLTTSQMRRAAARLSLNRNSSRPANSFPVYSARATLVAPLRIRVQILPGPSLIWLSPAHVEGKALSVAGNRRCDPRAAEAKVGERDSIAGPEQGPAMR
jgi:hypothetical protein